MTGKRPWLNFPSHLDRSPFSPLALRPLSPGGPQLHLDHFSCPSHESRCFSPTLCSLFSPQQPIGCLQVRTSVRSVSLDSNPSSAPLSLRVNVKSSQQPKPQVTAGVVPCLFLALSLCSTHPAQLAVPHTDCPPSSGLCVTVPLTWDSQISLGLPSSFHSSLCQLSLLGDAHLTTSFLAEPSLHLMPSTPFILLFFHSTFTQTI